MFIQRLVAFFVAVESRHHHATAYLNGISLRVDGEHIAHVDPLEGVVILADGSRYHAASGTPASGSEHISVHEVAGRYLVPRPGHQLPTALRNGTTTKWDFTNRGAMTLMVLGCLMMLWGISMAA